MVTHDRYFLDRVATRIVEVDQGKIYSYPGSYSEFVRLKEERQNMEIATERKRRSILRKELEWLMRGARARSTKQKAHIQRIEAMQENGVELLEIRGVDGQNIDGISATKAKVIRKMLGFSGLAVWSLGSPFGKIGINDDFAPHLDNFKHSLELADILGAKNICLFSFYGTSDIDPVLERLNAFIEAAKGTDIVLCHENEKGIYGDTAAKCLEIYKALPQLRAVFDPANFIQCGQDTIEAWESSRPMLSICTSRTLFPMAQ